MIYDHQILKPAPKNGYLSAFKKKYTPIKAIVITCTIAVSTSSHAFLQDSPQSTIKEMIAYPGLRGGNVVIQLERNGHGCTSGYWISENDPGFEGTHRMLLDAFRSGKNNIIIEGDNLKSWSNVLHSDYCHATSVRYSR